MKPIIFQYACDGHVKLLKLVEDHHRQLFSDCEYRAIYGYLQFSRSPHWNKVYILNNELRKLPDGQIVVWFDSDLIALHYFHIQSLLDAGYDIAMIQNHIGHWQVGMMVIKNGPAIRKAFSDAWEYGPLEMRPTEDQYRLNQTLAFGIKKLELPANYNLYQYAKKNIDPNQPIYIQAYHGESSGAAFIGMQKELERYGQQRI